MHRNRPYAPRRKASPLKSGLVAGAMGAALLTPCSPVHAKNQSPFPGVTLYMGYAFGGEDSGVAWGLEGHVNFSTLQGMCPGKQPAAIYGPMFRVGFVGVGQPRITIGGRAGVDMHEIYSTFSGEAGLTYQFGDKGGPALHLGGQAHFAFGGVTAFYELGLDEATVAGEIGLDTFARSCTVMGRPLRQGESYAALPEVVRTADDMDDAATRQAADIWEGRAQSEWASVPAFIEVAEQLQAVGAPASLVRRALDAAVDERHHAILAAGMSSKIGGGTLDLGNPKTSYRAPEQGEAGLIRLAVESWLDGCLGEGTAARTAFNESQGTDDPILGQVLSEIACDEAYHAGLAWDVLVWTLEVGGERVIRAVKEARELLPPDAEAASQSELEPFGIASSGRVHELALSNRQAALARLDAHLLGRKSAI